ncbi:hypothetical protein XENOCAPTIV_016460 [Xenoophorus captivus]|uniref:Secreted protein n=1 Tax=Xenoophorus captivus TaxID=1517983 RepID=A0ABV0QAA8_9TELE
MARPQSDLNLFVFVCILCVKHVCALEAWLLMSVRLFQMPVRVDDFIDPAPEAAHPGVQRRGGRVGAAVAPGNDPSDDPSA